MKKISFFLLVLVVAGCSKNGSLTSAPPTSNFKLELSQSGPYQGYVRLLSLANGMIYEGSTRQALVLSDGDISQPAYSFVTTTPIDVFSPSINVGWYGDSTGTAQLKFKIYEDDKLIDTQLILLKPVNVGQTQVYTWTYNAK